MSDTSQDLGYLDYVSVRERFAHFINQDFTVDSDFETLGYERLFLDMSIQNVLEFEASPFLVHNAKIEKSLWQYELGWLGYSVKLKFRPILKSVQIPDVDPIAIISPYTNTFVEAVCWAAWMEVKELDGNSTDPDDGFLFSLGLFQKGLQQLGVDEVPDQAIKKAVQDLHGFLKQRYAGKDVFRPADLAQGVCYLLSRLDQKGRESDLREALVGKFSLSCRLSLRDTYDRYAFDGDPEGDVDAKKKECLDGISHMAVYPDGRVIFLTDLEYEIIPEG